MATADPPDDGGACEELGGLPVFTSSTGTLGNASSAKNPPPVSETREGRSLNRPSDVESCEEHERMTSDGRERRHSYGNCGST